MHRSLMRYGQGSIRCGGCQGDGESNEVDAACGRPRVGGTVGGDPTGVGLGERCRGCGFGSVESTLNVQAVGVRSPQLLACDTAVDDLFRHFLSGCRAAPFVSLRPTRSGKAESRESPNRS
jgi:hypothetical protein